MKKSMLCAGLMTVFSATINAETNNNPNPLQTIAGAQTVATADTLPTPTTPGGIKTPTSEEVQKPSDPGLQTPTTTNPTSATGAASGAPTPATSTTAPASVTPQPTSTTTPVSDTQQQPAASTKNPTPAAQGFNCNYRIPAETTKIEQTIVMKWAEKAAEQSFDFDYNSIDKQIADLKPCYTEQGWQGFNDALQKSGNLNAIKSQQLTVSSMVNGQSQVSEIKDNQWKIAIPLQVVYQNDKEKLTQPLTVNLVVGRKVSGDLGIMQMIAVPSQTTTTPSNTPSTTPSSTTPATTPAQKSQ